MKTSENKRFYNFWEGCRNGIWTFYGLNPSLTVLFSKAMQMTLNIFMTHTGLKFKIVDSYSKYNQLLFSHHLYKLNHS